MSKAKSKGAKRRQKRASNQNTPEAPIEGTQGHKVSHVAPPTPKTVKLTPERASHGVIVPADRDKPAIALDALARLHRSGAITEREEQAGRSYQALAFAARRSIGIKGYVSCLAGGSGGYDSDDGQARAEREWREITTLLPVVSRAALDMTALDNEVPKSLIRLRYLKNALLILQNFWG